jgi:hypothetical protein
MDVTVSKSIAFKIPDHAMKYSVLKSAILLALCLAFSTGSSNADLVTLSEHSFEAGISMDFISTFGDQDASHSGLLSTNPRSGSQHFFGDLGNNGGGNGFGGTSTGVNLNPANFGPIEYGNAFSVSIWLAADATDSPTGGILLALEFVDADDNFLHLAAMPVNPSSLATNYQQFNMDYTVDSTDLPDLSLVTRVNAVLQTDTLGNTGDGRFFADDFRVSFGTTAIPEPSSAAIICMFAIAGLLRRSKR